MSTCASLEQTSQGVSWLEVRGLPIHSVRSEEPRVLPQDSDFYLCSLRSYGRYLCDSLPKPAHDAKGLVLITGETNCGKTDVLNALVYFFLEGLLKHASDKEPRPHIVAIGDPVETWLFPEQIAEKLVRREPQNYGTVLGNPATPLRFTARTKGLDVESVKQATKDALRETPKIFIVSELRGDRDFKAALEFAGTGHLILATAHATSLIDTMTKLMRIVKAESASDRALISQRVSMLAFLKPVRKPVMEDAPQFYWTVILPKVWRHDSAGSRAFVAEGLSSLQIPGALDSTRDPLDSEPGLLSYANAVEKLTPTDPPPSLSQQWRRVRREADRLDLKPT